MEVEDAVDGADSWEEDEDELKVAKGHKNLLVTVRRRGRGVGDRNGEPDIKATTAIHSAWKQGLLQFLCSWSGFHKSELGD